MTTYHDYRSPDARHDRAHLRRILFWIFIALALGVLAMAADGQEPTLTIQSPRLTRLDWSLLAADAGTRGLDVYSTHEVQIQPGGHEMFLPQAIADRPWAMAGVEAGDVLTVWWIDKQLIKHGHRKIARCITLADIGQDAPWAIRNLFLKGKKP